MEDLFPVVGEAGAETARSREEINREWEAQGLAKKTKRERGRITCPFPLFSLLKRGRRNRSAQRATWGASRPHRPQTIPRTSGCHRKSSQSKPRRRASDIRQSKAIIMTRRQGKADVGHDAQRSGRQTYRRPAAPNRTSRLRLPPPYSANFEPDSFDYSDATKTEKLEKSSRQAGKTPRSRGLVLGM